MVSLCARAQVLVLVEISSLSKCDFVHGRLTLCGRSARLENETTPNGQMSQHQQ